ncbi:hypothetical protein [Nocardia violaceofusca]|uniref:hypothetical protein n=1 Tax=Nocardia violaceofusca TaxID=941182 RepID=UPI0007A3F85A|nr:hypothetical protein [Nocardia violaceofusca]
MQQLRLRPEIQCYPTWAYRNGMYDNVSPESLGISVDLAHALNEWADRWDATYDLANDPGNPQFESPSDGRLFWEDGERLAERLRAELGSEWAVDFNPES